MNSFILCGHDCALALREFDYPVINLLEKWHVLYAGWRQSEQEHKTETHSAVVNL